LSSRQACRTRQEFFPAGSSPAAHHVVEQQEQNMPNLFEPIQLGSLVLANRVFMAPMTRIRAHADGMPDARHGRHEDAIGQDQRSKLNRFE